MPSDWPSPSGRARLRVSAERHHSAAAPGGGCGDAYWSVRPSIISVLRNHWWRQFGGGVSLPAAAVAGGTRAALGAGFGAPRVRGAATRRARCPGKEPGYEPGKERSAPVRSPGWRWGRRSRGRGSQCDEGGGGAAPAVRRAGAALRRGGGAAVGPGGAARPGVAVRRGEPGPSPSLI